MDIMIKELHTALDAFDLYSVFRHDKNVIFLDSAMNLNNLGKYSFIGINPFIVLKGRYDKCFINGREYRCGVFDKLSELLAKHSTKNDTGIPFTAGCIGYFSYDLGIENESVIVNSKEDLFLPHYYFVFYDNLIIIDMESGKKYVSACGMLENHNKSIERIEYKISAYKKEKYEESEKNSPDVKSNFTRAEYINAVANVKEYIRSGDIYIANLTQRLTAKTRKDSYEIYRDLRKINPAPFAALMRLDGFDVISSSPERFLKIDGRFVETRPIKGTRPRSKNPLEDARNRYALLNSEKDREELLMIVDLERNDLSKVCKPHSVKVTELFKLEEYSSVFHLVSTVVGELRDNIDAVQCFRACFPGGSITGTPKIRAMEIIDELEKLKRSLYTGCIGYFSFDGNADFNIIIRTIIKKGSSVYIGVGGGITWHSDEEAEYQETLDKAATLVKVI